MLQVRWDTQTLSSSFSYEQCTNDFPLHKKGSLFAAKFKVIGDGAVTGWGWERNFVKKS